MKTLKISEDKARELYKTADSNFKTILEETFGKDFFNIKITDRVKNFDDILRISGKKLEDILPWKNPINKNEISQNALAKIQLITEVYNEGKVLDWDNSNRYKCMPYFRKSGSGWLFTYCAYWNSYCYGGSVSYYYSSELAEDAAKKFIDIYNEYLP